MVKNWNSLIKKQQKNAQCCLTRRQRLLRHARSLIRVSPAGRVNAELASNLLIKLINFAFFFMLSISFLSDVYMASNWLHPVDSDANM